MQVHVECNLSQPFPPNFNILSLTFFHCIHLFSKFTSSNHNILSTPEIPTVLVSRPCHILVQSCKIPFYIIIVTLTLPNTLGRLYRCTCSRNTFKSTSSFSLCFSSFCVCTNAHVHVWVCLYKCTCRCACVFWHVCFGFHTSLVLTLQYSVKTFRPSHANYAQNASRHYWHSLTTVCCLTF